MTGKAGSAICLVTGATGAVGPRVVEDLFERGYQIRTLSLDGASSGLLPEEVDARIGDVNDASSVESAMRGVEVVIHLAALLHIVDPPQCLREQYERINVDGTATVVAAAIDAGIQRLVLFSTISVYGDTRGRIANEESPLRPDSFYAETKVAAERIILDAKRQDGRPLGTVLRLGAVYGSRIRGNYRRLLKSLARGQRFSIGKGQNRRTLIYDRDVARAALLAAEHPAAAGRVFNVSDGQFHTLTQIVDTMCSALGRRPPRLALPVCPVRMAAGMLEDIGRLIGRQSPVVRATVDKYLEDVAVDSRRIREELGFTSKYDLATGWRETVEGMRRAGDL